METDVDSVPPEMDRERVAEIFARYDLLTMPVIDDHGRILGMITIDDVVDILQAEATEDALKQVGVSGAEAIFASVPQKLRGRFPWLLANLFMSQLGSVALLIYADLIALIPVVAVFYPIIANQSGNSGNQSMAVTLRGIVLGQIKPERIAGLIRKELLFGLTCGVLIGTVFGVGASIVGPLVSAAPISGLWIGIVAGAAMTAALGVSCLIGVGVPLVLKRFGQDPATASSIFVTMLTDAISYATFLTLVFLMRDLVITAGAATGVG
jgi:magnesium transporter